MNDSPFWNEDWMRVQQQYWEQLGSMSRKAMGMDRPQRMPWEDAMDHWWKSISPGAPDATRAFMEKMLEQGKHFFRFSDDIVKNVSQSGDWSSALNESFEKMQDTFAASAERSSDAVEKGFSQWMGFWEAPMESWRKAAGSLPLNNDFAGVPNLFERLLGTPGLGYTREDEERYKELGQAWLHYQHALMSYNHFFADLGTASVRCMQDKVHQLTEKGERIDSARGLYDMWVAACEEQYTRHTMTPEYSRVHGELVNALMAFKKQWRELVDQRLGMMGMPTAREVRTLQSRLQESRRELRAMRSEMDLLKEQMNELRASKAAPETTAAPTTTRKKAAARTTTKKKVVRKKTAAK